MKVKIGFNLQATAMSQFHSLHNWCYQTMKLFQTTPDSPANDTLMEQHWADALYSTGKSLMNAMQSGYQEAEELEVYHMRQNELPSMLSRWLD